MKKNHFPFCCLALAGLILNGLLGSGEPMEEKTYTPEEPVQEIRLDVRDRQIEVSLSEDNQVHISYFENSREAYDIAVQTGTCSP